LRARATAVALHTGDQRFCGNTFSLSPARLAHFPPHLFNSEESDKWDEALTARLKAANVTLIPTLTLFSRDDEFDSILKEVKSYSDAHGQIMFGTDIGYLNDYSAQTKEYGYMARAG
jgi:hypothetical protein